MASRETEYFLTTYKQAAHVITTALRAAEPYIAADFPNNCTLRHETRRFVLEGGKRFRPAVSLVTAQMLGHGEVFPHLALETFHKYLLTHDDIIDRDDVRYNQPTVHAKLAQNCPNPQDQIHYGTALGIISGNLMEAATHKIILESDLPDEHIIALQKLIVRAVEEVCWGWHDQFLMDYLPLDSPHLSFERIEKSIIWVTGKYSIKLPLLFGYAVAGKTAPSGLEQLADIVGALYQTGDDLIGLFGDQSTTGKSNSGDITQGKKTLPLWLAYQAATPKQQATLQKMVGNKAATDKQVQQVRDIVVQSGGQAAAKDLMQVYCRQAMECLQTLQLPSKLSAFLGGFIAHLTERDR